MTTIPGLPDPVLTANIYFAGHLDQVVFQGIKLYRNAVIEQLRDTPFFLWTVRYGKSGEHLKLRIHSLIENRPTLQQLLQHETQKLFANLPLPSEEPKLLDSKARDWSKALAIDPEDNVEKPYPDRYLLWTSYRRSHITLGPTPFIESDKYVELCTLCLGAATDLLLALDPHFTGTLAYRYRYSTLLRALMTGMDVLDISAGEAARYHAYHRDWLLRFCLLKNWWNSDQANRAIELFDRRIEEKGLIEHTIDSVARCADDLVKRWQLRLRAFFIFASSLGESTKECSDPFADLPTDPLLFKVFHRLSNQLGLPLLDEALVHHVLFMTLRLGHSLDMPRGYSGVELRATR